MGGIVIVALSIIGGVLVATVDPYAGLSLIVGGGGAGVAIAWIQLG